MNDQEGSAPAKESGERWLTSLAAALGGDDAAADEFGGRVSAAYKEQTSSGQAAADLVTLAELALTASVPSPSPHSGALGQPHRLALVAGGGGEAVHPASPASPASAGDSRGTQASGAFRLRRYGREGIELSRLLPLVESFGLIVVEAVPHHIRPSGDQPGAHIDDIGLRRPAGADKESFDVHLHGGGRLLAALEAVTGAQSDLDSLNRLVLTAGLEWHQVALLRTYRRYRRQTGVSLSDAQLDEPLVAFPEVARRLLDYVGARFDPAKGVSDEKADQARAAVVDALDAVDHLEADQVLRAYLQLVDATVRTNWFQRGEDGRARPTIVVKLDSRLVPGLTPPLPKIETWVHSPAVEGIHLRDGLIARGGIRWSDRPDDFRTEILGLAEAQVKKNAIIVPTGAKGGFVVRRAVPGVADDPALTTSPGEVEAAYQLFIDSLFDVTDNIAEDVVKHPGAVMVLDGDDPYLVVAADRGTATFSDLANGISERHGFWLGDAFASGGSHGYDHKAMGITARGTWVAVHRHFHELGIDVASETIRVTGVGDLSGDVFGNGMLRSEAIALVAAFDHRHIFIDPDPDPAKSFVERRRMVGMARSSWDDYDRSVMSPGGGVWPRDAKVVELSPEARRALGVAAESLSPPEVISAILRAPVDLLFFGGIGTYIKAAGEADTEVGDHANNGVRVTAEEVRVRVIAEGGNLAITQAGRIRYSRRGGRINADFIDNAAGVATSDREVNLKILLTMAIEAGRLDAEARDGVLASATDDVAVEVLRQVDHSVAALNRAVPVSAHELDSHQALIESLEASGRLDRRVECLPGPEEFAVRKEAGAGLIRPELAVLLAYAKSDLVAAIEGSSLVRDGVVMEAVSDYFPPSFRALGPDLPPRHRLAPQLAATGLAGELVDRMGIAWTHETAAEMARPVVDVAAAFWAARAVLGAGSLWRALEDVASGQQGGGRPPDVEAREHRRISAAVAALGRRYLTLYNHPQPADLAASDRVVAEQIDALPAVRPDLTREGEGLPAELERRLGGLGGATYVADASSVARGTGAELTEVLQAFSAIDVAVAPGLIHRLESVSAPSRWSAWQSRALIDDLVAWRPRAVTAALMARRATPPVGNDGLGSAVDQWVAEHRNVLDRVDRLIASLDAQRPDVLSVAALLVRALAATA